MITYIRMRKLLRLLGIIPQENRKIIMIHHDILVILYKYQPIFILKNSNLFARTTLWFVKSLMTLQCFWFANLCAAYLNVLVYRLPGLEIKSWFRMADCKAYNQSILKLAPWCFLRYLLHTENVYDSLWLSLPMNEWTICQKMKKVLCTM